MNFDIRQVRGSYRGKPAQFENREIHQAIYATGWDGTVVIDAEQAAGTRFTPPAREPEERHERADPSKSLQARPTW
jgi:hypothetical protein